MAAYDELISVMVQNGISEDEARRAANNCLLRVGASGAAGWGAGSLLAPFLGFGALGTATLFAVTGSAYTLATSPKCSEVRQATDYWLKQGFGVNARP